jgi:hypothetical protein
MKEQQRVSAPRGGQPGDLAANRVDYDRIFLRRASMKTEHHARRIGNPGNVGLTCPTMPMQPTLTSAARSASTITPGFAAREQRDHDHRNR